MTGHCYWRLQELGQAEISFADARRRLENDKKFSVLDKQYLRSYIDAHFEPQIEVSHEGVYPALVNWFAMGR
jgi:hypothetical protein